MKEKVKCNCRCGLIGRKKRFFCFVFARSSEKKSFKKKTRGKK